MVIYKLLSIQNEYYLSVDKDSISHSDSSISRANWSVRNTNKYSMVLTTSTYNGLILCHQMAYGIVNPITNQPDNNHWDTERYFIINKSPSSPIFSLSLLLQRYYIYSSPGLTDDGSELAINVGPKTVPRFDALIQVFSSLSRTLKNKSIIRSQQVTKRANI